MKRIKIPKHVKEFAFDGCHKIFLIDNDEQKKEMRKRGYKKADILPVSKLVETYNTSCPLRAIWFWDHSKKALVEQCEDKELSFIFE